MELSVLELAHKVVVDGCADAYDMIGGRRVVVVATPLHDALVRETLRMALKDTDSDLPLPQVDPTDPFQVTADALVDSGRKALMFVVTSGGPEDTSAVLLVTDNDLADRIVRLMNQVSVQVNVVD